MQSNGDTFKHELRWHVGYGANGSGLHHLPLPEHPCQPKVSHLGSEPPLIIAVAGQEDVVAGQVAVQDVQPVEICHGTAATIATVSATMPFANDPTPASVQGLLLLLLLPAAKTILFAALPRLCCRVAQIKYNRYSLLVQKAETVLLEAD